MAPLPRRTAAKQTLSPSYLKRVSTNLAQNETGHTYVPSVSPPSFIVAPWFSLSISTVDALPATKDTYYLIDLAREAIGVPDSTRINIRILSIRVWAHKTAETISLGIYGDNLSNTALLTQIQGTRSPTSCAKVGWRFGTSSFAKLRLGTEDEHVPVFTLTGDVSPDQPAITYIQTLIQFQPKAGLPPPNSLVDKPIAQDGSPQPGSPQAVTSPSAIPWFDKLRLF